MVRMFRMDAGSNGAKFGRCGHDDGLTAVTMTIDPIDNNSIRFDQAEEEKSKKRGWEGGISKDEVVNLWSWRLRRAAARLESLPKNKSGGGSAMPLLALYCHFKNQRESANMLSLEDTPTAMARTLFALLVLSNLPSDLCFE